MGKMIKSFFLRLKNALTNRIGLKLLSLILALILWNYIIDSTPSLTRAKKVEGLNVSVSGVSTLNNNGLALLTDVFNEYAGSVTATVDISQKEYYRASYETLSVYADVSNIRTIGTHIIPLTAVSNKGTVKSLEPANIKVVVESLDSREVPVQVNLVGDKKDHYWYSVNEASVNPQMITVSGPASLVLQINTVTANVDITGHTQSMRRASLLNMQNSTGEDLNKRLLSRSSSTCSVTVDIYPTKEIPLKANASEISVADGYEIVDISFQPPVVTVAAEQTLLDDLDSLFVEIPSSDTPLTQTRTKRTNITRLSEFKYISSRQAVMTVTVREVSASKTLTAVPIEIYGLANGYDAYLSNLTAAVTVHGYASDIEELEAKDIKVYVDVNNLGSGMYSLPTYVWNQPNISYDQVTPEYVTVTITRNHKNDVSIDAEG